MNIIEIICIVLIIIITVITLISSTDGINTLPCGIVCVIILEFIFIFSDKILQIFYNIKIFILGGRKMDYLIKVWELIDRPLAIGLFVLFVLTVTSSFLVWRDKCKDADKRKLLTAIFFTCGIMGAYFSASVITILHDTLLTFGILSFLTYNLFRQFDVDGKMTFRRALSVLGSVIGMYFSFVVLFGAFISCNFYGIAGVNGVVNNDVFSVTGLAKYIAERGNYLVCGLVATYLVMAIVITKPWPITDKRDMVTCFAKWFVSAALISLITTVIGKTNLLYHAMLVLEDGYTVLAERVAEGKHFNYAVVNFVLVYGLGVYACMIAGTLRNLLWCFSSKDKVDEDNKKMETNA